jgi:SAM-dependent methyltransferase
VYGFGARDGDLAIDWGRTSADYAAYRPGYPQSFFDHLAALGIPQPGMRVLDLGTGTGNLGRSLARRGARVLGIDVSPEQVAQARRLAVEEGLDVDFEVAPAEAVPREDGAFDLACASQCWLYFDHVRTVAEVRRLLAPGGRLLVSFIGWLPLADPVAGATEQLVLQHNPAWSASGFDGEIPDQPDGTHGAFEVEARLCYDEEISFTRASWRGRIRACRGIGATLEPSRVAAFDAELEALLRRIAPEEFTVLHRIHAVLLRPLADAVTADGGPLGGRGTRGPSEATSRGTRHGTGEAPS